MKKLKFVDNLPDLILSGKKIVTWRINDEKNISTGDELSLCDLDGNEFAKAKAIDVKETTFENLTEDDKEGHERYSNDEEMYKVFSKLYNMNVTPKTELKIIKFELIK